MNTAQQLMQIADNVPLVYAAGAQAEKDRCALEHFVAVVPGDGSQELHFTVPFEPDILSVTGFEPAAHKKANVVAQLHANLASFGYIAALSSAYNAAGALATTAMTTESILNRYARQDDGSVTISNVRGASTDTVAVFQQDLPYVVAAVRYDKPSDAQRITEYVQSLTGSGTAMLSARKIYAAFTEEQWQALIAQKPDWTFTLN